MPHPRARLVWVVARRQTRRARPVAVALIATMLVGVAVPGMAHADDDGPLGALDARRAWAESTGDGVTVAVVDSGVDATHPDLLGQVLPGIDFVDARGDGRVDAVGHGTAIASFIAGQRTGDVVGLAPAAKVLPVRVLDARNRYDDAVVVARGVQWAVDHGARVINLSLGGAGYSAALADALDYALAHDVVVIACTGNVLPAESRDVWFPAREPGVVAVAGLDGDAMWSSSLTGTPTVLTAPATRLRGARPGGGYARVQGTSFAASFVSATVALIRAKWPRMSAANVVQRLIRTARDLGPVGRDDRFGYGAVDPVAALHTRVAEVEANPLGAAPPAGTAGFGPASGTTSAGAAPNDCAGIRQAGRTLTARFC